MNPPSRRSPTGAVGALVAAFGFGLALWNGWDWYRLPRWTPAEIEQSVDLNLALDLKRSGAALPGPEQTRALRDQIRAELHGQIRSEREIPRGYTIAGLVIGVFGLLQALARRRLAAPRSG